MNANAGNIAGVAVNARPDSSRTVAREDRGVPVIESGFALEILFEFEKCFDMILSCSSVDGSHCDGADDENDAKKEGY